MDILELFTGKKKKRAKGHLKNLLEVATSDGSLDGIEVDFLLSLAGRFNISEQELREIKDHPSLVEYNPPTADRERFDHLYQLVSMMMVDGKVHEKELEICKNFAVKLGLRPEFVADMIQVINEDEKRETPTEVIISKLLKIAQARESERKKITK